jgi:protein AroM
MVTIGQSPRVDVVPEIQAIMGRKIEVVECGALDGLSREEVKRLSPAPEDHVLVTRMRKGEEVTVGEEKIISRLQACVDQLAKQCSVLALLCTGKFPQLSSDRPILMPEALLDGMVNGILGVKTLGVLIPSAAQTGQLLSRWKRPGRNVVAQSASPYSKDDEITPSARRLAASDPDLLILDCMGYTLRTKEIVSQITEKPVILPRSVLAHSITELVV